MLATRLAGCSCAHAGSAPRQPAAISARQRMVRILIAERSYRDSRAQARETTCGYGSLTLDHHHCPCGRLGVRDREVHAHRAELGRAVVGAAMEEEDRRLVRARDDLELSPPDRPGQVV